MPYKAMRRGGSSRRLGPLVPLGDDLLVEDAHLLHHQQPHVLHYLSCQLLLGDVLTFYVEPETLPLQAAPVGEVHLEVELHPLVGRVFVVHRSPIYFNNSRLRSSYCSKAPLVSTLASTPFLPRCPTAFVLKA
jgi:hypothetical protein